MYIYLVSSIFLVSNCYFDEFEWKEVVKNHPQVTKLSIMSFKSIPLPLKCSNSLYMMKKDSWYVLLKDRVDICEYFWWKVIFEDF